jgi:hypothetical protein
MVAVAFHSHANLCIDVFILAQKGEISVCGSTCDDLQMTGILKLPEGPDDISVISFLEILFDVSVMIAPLQSPLGEALAAPSLESNVVFLGSCDFLIQVILELHFEVLVGELLAKNGGQAQRQAWRTALGDQICENV